MNFLSNLPYIGAALLGLLFMVTVHEFGHYLAGKALGFKINEFAVGFGPKLLWRRRKNGEIFSLRAIPLGGFCAFEDEDEEAASPDSFNAKPPWKRIIVLLSGVTMNFLASMLIVILVFAFTGMTFPRVTHVLPDSNQAQTSADSSLMLQEGDIILEANGRFLYAYLNGDMTKALSGLPEGRVVTLKVLRGGSVVETEVVMRNSAVPVRGEDGKIIYNEDGSPQVKLDEHYLGLGILNEPVNQKLPFFEMLWRGVVYTFYLGFMILEMLGRLITSTLGLEAVGGPITTIGAISEVARHGLREFMVVIALVGVNFAVFNLLPIPALDGSRVVFTAIEWVRGKPVSRRIEGTLHLVGLLLLFGLIIVADVYQQLIIPRLQ